MPKYKIIATKFWIKIIEPVWSFIINAVFWVLHLNKIGITRRRIDILKRMKLDAMMVQFHWREDNLKDWTPWIMTIVYRDLMDD